jgi:hypothetical protein
MIRLFLSLLPFVETPEPPLAVPAPVITHRSREFNGGERTFYLPRTPVRNCVFALTGEGCQVKTRFRKQTQLRP